MTTTLIPMAVFSISGVAMSTIEGSGLYQTGDYDGSPEARRAHEALKAARVQRRGKGLTYTVTTDMVAAGIIWDYCWTVGSTFAAETEADTRRDGRALLQVAERVEICCAKAGWSKPTPTSGPLPPPGQDPQLWVPDAAAQPATPAAEPELTSQAVARREAERRNAAGEVSVGCVAVAQPYPADAWGGEEEGWRVAEVAAPDGGDPVRARRNTTSLRDGKSWSGKATEYVLMGGPGEPTRTWEDMRLALSGQLQRYLNRFPDPAGAVDDALAYRTASLIVGDHYQHPGTVAIQREHALKYVALARERMG